MVSSKDAKEFHKLLSKRNNPTEKKVKQAKKDAREGNDNVIDPYGLQPSKGKETYESPYTISIVLDKNDNIYNKSTNIRDRALNEFLNIVDADKYAGTEGGPFYKTGNINYNKK